jgi:hypothetical protein
MPGLIKIGYTNKTPYNRIAELNTTGVPMPFVVAASFAVENGKECESDIHNCLESKRISKNREFFNIDIGKAIEESMPIILKYIAHTYAIQAITPEKKVDSQIEVDNDDIYFMQFILHDGFDRKGYLSTEELSSHHKKYHPFELEIKLGKLKDKGVLERKQSKDSNLSLWKITPLGINFMVENNFVLQDLIRDYKSEMNGNFSKNFG